jgi:hypothetical protein
MRHSQTCWLAAIGLACALLGLTSSPAGAQSAEDELGNWLIYNGTFRFSQQWSVFTEAQLRLWEVASNLNEVLARATLHYDFPESQAMVGLGYVRADSWPYDDSGGGGRERIENRIYQQFAIRQNWLRTLFEHRYRLEQRWLKRTATGETDFSLRVRYRMQITTPLNRETMEPGAWFLNFYDEIFINFDDTRVFDQNRLYGAAGFQFTQMSNLQLGLLWQARSTADFWRLQVFYTHNFDFRDES